MGTIGASIATQLEAANAELIAAVAGMDDARWRAATPGEQRPVGVIAHHVALSHTGLAGLVKAIAAGEPVPPLTREQIDEGNARQARENADCTRQEALALLRENGAAAAAIVRAIPDEGFSRTASFLGRDLTAREAAERVLAGHPRQHLASIRAAG